MRLIRKILLFIFDIIDERIHQKNTDLIFKIEENSKVIMIEPQGKYYSLLKYKYINNKQVEVIKVGLSDKKKKIDIEN